MKGRFRTVACLYWRFFLGLFSPFNSSVTLLKTPEEKGQGFTDGIDRGDGGIPFSFYDSTDIAILQIRKGREGRFGHLSFFSDFFDCNASGFQ